MGNEKKISSYIIIGVIAVLLIAIVNSCSKAIEDFLYEDENTLRIIASSSTKSMESDLKSFASKNGYDLKVEYKGDLDIVKTLNDDASKYDAVWISNSIWLYMLDNSYLTSESKSIVMDPVVLGIKKSKASEIGFVNKDVYNKDIVNVIKEGKLKYVMASVTKTNTGATTYLNFLNSLAGNPEVLTSEHLSNPSLKSDLKSFFKGVERVSGDEEYLLEMYQNGNYDAMINYESTLINLNQKLVKEGKEPLYLIYPVDGVAINDMPLAFIDHKQEGKKEVFLELQSYLRSDEVIKKMETLGYRSWYGGVKENTDKNVFNPEWGIDTSKYLKDMKYPSKKIMTEAINLFIEALRKPTHVVFCLDVSGSMYGSGLKTLKEAMNYILDYEKASKDNLQFSKEDKITIIPFNGKIVNIYPTKSGSETSTVIKYVDELDADGNTNIYDPSIKALEILKNDDSSEYTKTVILMTDGQSNTGYYSDLEYYYKKNNLNIPIYAITFGNSSEKELYKVTTLTNGKIFDGKSGLKEAFQEVRSYN